MLHPEKNHFEFFKDFKKETPIKAQSSFITMWAMFLFTCYKLLNSFSRINKKVAFMLFFSLVFSAYFYYENDVKKQHKIDSIVLTKGRAEFIKSFDSARINMIESYILTTKETEKKKINDIYWTAQYIMTEEKTGLNNNALNVEINRQMQAVDSFYSSLSKNINMAYSLVKADKALLVLETNSDNLLETLIDWDSKAKAGGITFLPETNNLVIRWNQYLKDPVAHAVYMEKNKNIIAKSSMGK